MFDYWDERDHMQRAAVQMQHAGGADPLGVQSDSQPNLSLEELSFLGGTPSEE